MKVFVYGTLKKGFGNHPVLGDAKFIGEDVTVDAFKMLDAGFPVIMPPSGRMGNDIWNVTGEVYEIPDDAHGAKLLHGLDRLEGEGNMYHRKVAMTQGGHLVSMYVGDERCWRGHDTDISKSKRVKVDEASGTVSYVQDQR